MTDHDFPVPPLVLSVLDNAHTVGETVHEAFEGITAPAQLAERGYHRFWMSGHHAMPVPQPGTSPELWILGSSPYSAQVADRLGQLQEQAGVDEVMLAVVGHSRQVQARTVELIADHYEPPHPGKAVFGHSSGERQPAQACR